MAPEPRRDVARVLVDVGLAHLDRAFDYSVPPELDESAQPGARVRVRFAGRRVSGFILDRSHQGTHPGDLSPLERVVSPERVLTPQIAELARRVADHYAGSRADVLRLAVPARHARTEAATPAARDDEQVSAPDPGGWADYRTGTSLVRSLIDGGSPRAVATLAPGAPWPDLLAITAAATASSGRGTVILVPDTKGVARVDQALSTQLGPGRHVVLHAEQGPSARYRRFLAVVREQVPVVVGTRSAAYAPVARPGLLVVWDDGDDLHAEQRAPYPHARDVALIRAHQQGCGVLIAGFARTAEAHRLVRSGWAREVRADRGEVRRHAPTVSVATDSRSGMGGRRIPQEVFDVTRVGLRSGPVLVQVPRHGYRPALACQQCRTRARCPRCSGPLAQPTAGAELTCRWCGHDLPQWRCAACGSDRLRATALGERRTAEELGRAFPGVPVRRSGTGEVRTDVPDEPALVVATPGAEPVCASGYAAAVLLDGEAMLARPDLRAAEETLRRWLAVGAMVRPAAQQGAVCLVADPAHRAVQALLRWDPAGFADRELDERIDTRLPPAWRVAELTGPQAAVADLLDRAALPDGHELLGPVPLPADEGVRTLVRCRLSDGAALSRALREASGVRRARREAGTVRVRVDPVDLG